MFESGNDCETLEIWKLLKITSHLIHYSTIEKKDQDRDKKPAFSVLDRVIYSSFGPKKDMEVLSNLLIPSILSDSTRSKSL